MDVYTHNVLDRYHSYEGESVWSSRIRDEVKRFLFDSTAKTSLVV